MVMMHSLEGNKLAPAQPEIFVPSGKPDDTTVSGVVGCVVLAFVIVICLACPVSAALRLAQSSVTTPWIDGQLTDNTNVDGIAVKGVLLTAPLTLTNVADVAWYA